MAQAHGGKPIYCPVCSGVSKEVLRLLSPHGGVWPILECKLCGLRYTWPQPSQDELEAFYERLYGREDKAASLYDDEFNNKYWSRQAAVIIRLVRLSSGRILDIGCGGGHFLLHMKGWEKFGVELSAKARAAAASRGITTFANLHQARFPDSFFDVVTMFAVIEHMADPRGAILEVARIVKPGGLLVIMTGDALSVKARIKGKRWHMYRPPEHLFFFDGRSLDHLASLGGFTRVHRYYTDGGMTTSANRYIRKMLRLSIGLMDRLPWLPCVPLFDHNYSYYRKNPA